MVQEEKISMKSLMPEKGYLATLADRTGKFPSYISMVVRHEMKQTAIWPAIEKLAQETNPKGFKAYKQQFKKTKAVA